MAGEFLRQRAQQEQRAREREIVALGEELGKLLDLAQANVKDVAAWAQATKEGHVVASGLGSGKPWQVRVAEAQDSLRALRSLKRQLVLVRAEGEAGLTRDKGQGAESQGAVDDLLRRLDGAYTRLHTLLHDAQIGAQHQGASSGREQQLLAQRAMLLGEDGALGDSQFRRRRQLRSEEDKAAAAQEVTQSLRRTQQVMAQEVQRGLGTMEVLDDSTATLGKSGSQYEQQKGKLSTAHSRLTQLQRMNRQDRLILVLGVLFFLGVCCFIVFRRLPLLRQLLHGLLSILIGQRELSQTPEFVVLDENPGLVNDSCPQGICMPSE